MMVISIRPKYLLTIRSYNQLKTDKRLVLMEMGKMLQTAKERVALLKAGISGKSIERLYLIYNNIKIVGNPLLTWHVESNLSETESKIICPEIPAESAEVST